MAFYDDSMNKIPVNNYQPGIYFKIPKTLNATPAFEAVNLSNVSISAANQIQTFGVVISSPDQAVIINLMPSNLTIGYLMCAKYGEMPIVNSSYQNNIDKIQIFCPSNGMLL
jgi:hypothetical protein